MHCVWLVCFVLTLCFTTLAREQHELVVYTHVPKTGGTSLSRELRQQAPSRTVYREAFPRALTPAAQWVYGKQEGDEWVHVPFRDLPERVRREATLVTVLRDPVQRLQSAYRFNRDRSPTEYTALLRHTPLDHLVRHWRDYPQLSMQFWQPQLTLFFSDDSLPQRAWIDKNGCVQLGVAEAEQCSAPLSEHEHFSHRWKICGENWERRAREVVNSSVITIAEKHAIALMCAQERLGLFRTARGRNAREKRQQHLRYSLGRADSAASTLRERYSAVLHLESLSSDLRQLDRVVDWFDSYAVSGTHANASPPRKHHDTSYLSPEAIEILQREVLVDDFSVLDGIASQKKFIKDS